MHPIESVAKFKFLLLNEKKKKTGTTAIFSQTKHRFKQNNFKTVFLLNKGPTSA